MAVSLGYAAWSLTTPVWERERDISLLPAIPGLTHKSLEQYSLTAPTSHQDSSSGLLHGFSVANSMPSVGGFFMVLGAICICYRIPIKCTVSVQLGAGRYEGGYVQRKASVWQECSLPI